jgi:hypothetical protein
MRKSASSSSSSFNSSTSVVRPFAHANLFSDPVVDTIDPMQELSFGVKIASVDLLQLPLQDAKVNLLSNFGVVDVTVCHIFF